MSGIAIVTDSTCTIPDDLIAKYKIGVAPQVLIWEGKTLYDGVDMTPQQFYEKLAQASQLPTTSQATVASFQKLFAPLVQQGRPIVAILLSSKLSGTVQSALQAKQDFPGAQIEVIDTDTVGMALGWQVLLAARQVEAGASFQDVVAAAREAKKHVGILIVVDTLEFLHRGGRIGGAARLVGTLLNFKPILEVQDGRVEPLERVRTRAKAMGRMLELVEQRIQGHNNVRISAMHGMAEQDARSILEQAEAHFHPIETTLSWATPVLGAHTGPGTLALSYCVDL
ncbi:MAG TPA: DegV family protein [Anaerolineales bacterium]|nr:DegV family protein [Anaerolineales bacterium]